MNKKRCKECGQVISKKVYYVGDVIDEGLGAILLDKREANLLVGQFVLAIVPSHRVFYVWYLNENNVLENGQYFLSIREAIDYYGRA